MTDVSLFSISAKQANITLDLKKDENKLKRGFQAGKYPI